MQPYFFPYPGYFSMIKATDHYVVFDTPQYAHQSWMNRNRILDLNSNRWKYINVPVKRHHLNTAINLIDISNSSRWVDRIVSQLDYYKKYAPYYKQVIQFLKATLKKEFKKLSDLNIHTIESTCDYIGLEFNFEVFSKMNTGVDHVNASDEWGLKICQALGYREFLCPEGGKDFVERSKYAQNDIKLHFLAYSNPAYDQKRPVFEPALSILDAMMFNTPKEIFQMLDEYKLFD